MLTVQTLTWEAGVSNWLVYALTCVNSSKARARQAPQGHQDQQSGRKISTTSDQTDLLHAQREIKRLQTENCQLRQRARAHLGQQVEQLGNRYLVDRVNELTEVDLLESRGRCV
ncbi:hypothetical protein EAO69_28410 [Streptomyces sp. me109]|uniref:hypothetical protein n=1 Tax=Streptomyces sp. me109 TaxID=1827853 RepID=UPI0011CE0346|nr:hypothetical protein [Streptomyces sp. me109]TXS66418.1 hypothetical protein EAO69_28410 [Streptomyces sp. me109]